MLLAGSLLVNTAAAQPLLGQIRKDPQNGSYLVYNRDRNGDGRLDPFFAIGPGEPEGFFYLGERRSDGTRTDARQQEIIRRVRQEGGNALYIQMVRSHGGDGEPDHNPWNEPADPASGVNPGIIAQWKGWLDQMREAGIVVFLFIYDDGAHPFDDSGCQTNGEVSEPEQAFVSQMIREFDGYPNLVWIVQEEFRFIKAKKSDENTTPCNDARLNRARNLAGLIKRTDRHQHVVGIHHNVGVAMQFPADTVVDLYMQQADVRKTWKNLDTLHAQGLTGFDHQHRYNYTMGECFDWHRWIQKDRDRALLRKTYFASAMAGGNVLVLAMFDGKTPDPTPDMLGDMRRMQTFFEAIPFNRMAPGDNLRHGGTRWVLANSEAGQYVLYAHDSPASLGVKNLRSGIYTLTWFDPATGKQEVKRGVKAGGDAVFAPPATIKEDVVLYLSRN